jgi:hypothetical protein
MTTRAVTQEAIEDALIARFQGITIDVESSPTPVEVLMEEPSVEEVVERTYPSVAMMYLGEVPDYEIRDSDDDEGLVEEVLYDPGPPVHERVERAIPQALKLSYSIDTWNKTRAQESRDLLFRAVRARIGHRGYLQVLNIEGQPINLWMFWSGGVTPLNEKHPDMIVYHNSLTVDILAYVTVAEVDDTTTEKVAMEQHWKVFSKKVDENVGDQLDVEMAIDENGVRRV